MSTNADWLERRRRAVPAGIANACPITVDRAENSEIWDVEGRRFVDFAGGIAVLNVGHRHPAVVEAVQQQLGRVTHPCFQVTPYAAYVELAERLNALAPGDFEKQTIFLTTGAEAVENAVKIARRHTGRDAVVVFSGAFHGRTLLTMAMTGKTVPYKDGLGPFPSEVYRVPYPIEYRHLSAEHSLLSLDLLFRTDVAPERIACIILEPVLGEGGFYQAPAEFWRGLRRLCDDHGIVLVADEIQSGIARTGRMFAVEHSGVAPDLITVAKSLGGGLPLSGVIGRSEIMASVPPGGLGGTYAGNALSCAAGLAVLDVIDREGLLERADALGARITDRLRSMAEELDCIGDVRGVGAMCALELVHDRETKEPAPDLAKAVSARALQDGLIVLACGLWGNCLRILVPLTAADALVDEGLDILHRSIREVVSA